MEKHDRPGNPRGARQRQAAQIDRLSEAIEEQIRPFAAAVELLCSIPGVQRRIAEVMVAEMSVLPSAGHPASRAGLCPGNDESAGKRRSGRTRNGSCRLSIALTEAAQANARSRDSYLSAQYRRLRARRGHKKAIGAVKHSTIAACWHMLTTGELYNDAGGGYFTLLGSEVVIRGASGFGASARGRCGGRCRGRGGRGRRG